jgi:hypothetical protein
VLERPLRFQEVPPEFVRERFIAMGFGVEFADAYLAYQAASVEQPALVTHDVEKILGRPPQSFADWVAEHRDLFTNQ